MLDPKIVESMLQLGALGIMAVFITVFMLNTFRRQQKTADFMEQLTTKSIEAIQNASIKHSDTQRAYAEAMAKLANEISKSQEQIQEAFRRLSEDIEENKKSNTRRAAEHEQLLRDHREIMRRLEHA
jgi:nitrogenase subunit NifH